MVSQKLKRLLPLLAVLLLLMVIPLTITGCRNSQPSVDEQMISGQVTSFTRSFVEKDDSQLRSTVDNDGILYNSILYSPEQFIDNICKSGNFNLWGVNNLEVKDRIIEIEGEKATVYGKLYFEGIMLGETFSKKMEVSFGLIKKDDNWVISKWVVTGLE